MGVFVAATGAGVCERQAVSASTRPQVQPMSEGRMVGRSVAPQRRDRFVFHAMVSQQSAPRSPDIVAATAREGAAKTQRRAIPRLDRYRLLSVVGAGAMGQVWRAHDPLLSRDVAIKLIAGRSASRAMLERLGREARAMAKLADPHVVGVFDVGTYALVGEERGVYIVMELIEGSTLAQWLATPRTTSAILDAFVQAGLGLAAAHDAGLVHRDFKPANVLVGDDGRVRVGDFGLARRGSEVELEHREIVAEMIAHEVVDTVAGSLTESGFVMGTPLYMAPEQHRGGQVDARSDQYAFCVALYEALAGVRPFQGDVSAIHRAKAARVLLPPAAGREIADRLRAIVERGLAPEPTDRWPSMRALVAALRVRPRWRAWQVWAGVAAAMAIGVVAVVGEPGHGQTCGELARIDRAWDEPRRRAITSALRDASGSESASRVAAAIDGQAEALREQLAQRCDGSAAGACLRDATTELVTTLEVFATDPRAAKDALAAVRRLADPRTCADASGSAPPELAAIRDAGATANALANAGQLDRAVATAVVARDQARALGAAGAPMAARMSYRVAAMRDELGLDSLAQSDFEDAHFAAVDLDDDALAASAAIRLAVLLTETGSPIDADRWRRHARASATRARFATCDEHEYEMFEALIEGLRDEVVEARARLRKLVDRCPVDTCEQTCFIARSNLAEAIEQGDGAVEALALRREVLDRYRMIHGADSAQAATAELGVAKTLLEVRPEEALELLAGTVPRIEALLGRDHPFFAQAMVLEAQARRDVGDKAGAVAAARRALELGEQFFDGDTRRREAIRGTLANTLGDVGDYEGALRLYDSILDDPTTAASSRRTARISRGYTRMQSGDIDGAIADARAARAELPSHESAKIELTYANEAAAELAAGRCAEADRVLVDAAAWAERAALDDARARMLEGRTFVAEECATP